MKTLQEAIRKFRARKAMPKTVKKWWYCGEWCTYRSEMSVHEERRSAYVEYPIEGKFMFNPHDTVLGNQDLVEGLIPAYRHNGYIGLYKQVGHAYYGQGQGAHSDWASWDDGLNIDLRLVKVITVQEFKKVFPPRKWSPSWIPVEERLPDNPRVVKVKNGTAQPDGTNAQYMDGKWFYISSDIEMCGITHWSETEAQRLSNEIKSEIRNAVFEALEADGNRQICVAKVCSDHDLDPMSGVVQAAIKEAQIGYGRKHVTHQE